MLQWAFRNWSKVDIGFSMKTLWLFCICLCCVEEAFSQFPEWKHAGSIWLDTFPSGGDVPESTSVRDFPLLVRLHKDFFDFSQARANGEDLRFSFGGEPIAYQIEQWEPLLGEASIWVRIPKISGFSHEEIKLHWGNPNAQSESDGKAVFNESNGYLSVWHMSDPVEDSVGTLPSDDNGTTTSVGRIGSARHLPGQKGIFSGEKIRNYPSGASSHSTEAWFRAERSNATILGWGNEGGGRGSKVRMQLRSPPHVHIDSDFSDVKGKQRIPMNEWVHVFHTYDRADGKIYINGQLDTRATPMLDIKNPSRLWIGGWYHNYDYIGDVDEVRISRVARSPEWIRLQYENQKPNQTVIGHVVQPAGEFSVSHKQIELKEGASVTIQANPSDARKVYWELKAKDAPVSLVADRFSYTLNAGRTVGNKQMNLRFRAHFADSDAVQDIPVTIIEDIPEPEFTLTVPTSWDGRETIEIVPTMINAKEMQSKGAGQLKYDWKVENIAVLRQIGTDRLVLKRAQGSGLMKVSVSISNGGEPVVRSATVAVKEPAKDSWLVRVSAEMEMPVDNQFFARDDSGTAALHCVGTLKEAANSVFLKVYAEDVLIQTESQDVQANKKYAIHARLKPGLIKYRIEFGSILNGRENVLYRASNLICGDAFLIDGQSNAEATDVGPTDPKYTSNWIRSFGSPAGDPQNARQQVWSNAVVRDRKGGKAQIGYWGMELAKRLVERHKMPICIINGAVGGTRIDQHQRNDSDPTDVNTIYGRLLWRVQQAKLTHGIRGVLWHQGENDQGADGPTGGYGWEKYRQLFVDMAGAWKEDYPNIQHYYAFQIWPKACSMGIDGSDNRLREVQRSLANSFSNLSLMSTLGIKPPGGCHFPIEGYAEFARLICPLIERDHYGVRATESITPPNLQRVSFTTAKRDEVELVFDSELVWSPNLISQFYLDDQPGLVSSGNANGNRVLLKLMAPTESKCVSYLDSKSWSQDKLLLGRNGIAALTFYQVPIEETK